MATLSERLKELRACNNVSQADVATAMGLSLSGYQRYEYGGRFPDAEGIIALANYFQCSSDYLLGLADFKNHEEKTEYNDKIENALPNLEKCQAEIRALALSILSDCGNMTSTLCNALDIINDLKV